MAADIERDHPRGVHLIAVLKGAFVFLFNPTIGPINPMDATHPIVMIPISRPYSIRS